MLSRLPFLGVGLGYREQLTALIDDHAADIDWLELITEHYIQTTPERQQRADDLRKRFVLSPHGIEMSIGTETDPDDAYIDELANLVARVGAPWFSDHLSFTRAGGIALGQLIPLVRTRATALTLAKKAQNVQDRVGVPFLLENIAYYFEIGGDLTEAEFITEVMERCECGLLLDITNLFTNSVNHDFDPYGFLDAIPLERVVQVHLAGGEFVHDTLLDAHGFPVPEEVWDLLDVVARRCAVKGAIIERDQNFPSDHEELLAELSRARTILTQAQAA